MENKMTNRKALEFVLSTYGEDLPKEVKEKCEGMVAQLLKKSASKSGSGKMTATQKANADLKTKILEHMVVGKGYLCSDMLTEFDFLDGMSTSKVSALVNQLVKDGKVEKASVKGRSYFTKA